MEEIKLLLVRKYKLNNYTIGKLYINGEYFCDTMEDKDRGLTQNMSLQEIKCIKVYGETAIPYGTYDVTITYSPKFKKDLPSINKVPGYEGIRIHSGNTAKDSLGCILVGFNKAKGMILESKKTIDQLMAILTKARKISIKIVPE